MENKCDLVAPDYTELPVPSIDLMDKLGIGIIQVEDALVLVFRSSALMQDIGRQMARGGEASRIALAPMDADPEYREVALDIARELFPYE